jgi:hypothetical protein
MHMATRTSALLTLLTIAAMALAPPAAFSDPEDATIGFYLTDASGRCSSLEPPSCATEDVQVSGILFTPYYAVLCVFNADPDSGVVGVSCGIRYDAGSSSGVDVWGWTRCADGLEFPSDKWPDSGNGVRITWLECQKEQPDGFDGGVTAVIGYLYVTAYSPDQLEVIENIHLDSGPELLTVHCGGGGTGAEVAVAETGTLGFSDDESEKGDLPCVKIIREDSTWGAIKSLYDNR